MKLYQLLQVYEFDEIMPVINDMFPGTSKFRDQLKMAYEMLMTMRPVESKKTIQYKIMPGDMPSHSFIGAEDNQFDAPWDVLLGKDVSRSQGVDLSDVELAANVLVNLCLLGRSPKSFEKAHQDLMRG